MDQSDDNNRGSLEESQVQQCNYCKTNNPFDFKFCSKCGKILQTELTCFSCFKIIPPSIKFCPYCGIYLQTPPLHNPGYNPYPYIPIPTNYDLNQRFHHYSKPKWWNLPVFYLIYCMFGLILLSSVIIIFLAVILGIDINDFKMLLILEILVKLAGLLFIFIAIKGFSGFKNFYSKIYDQNSLTELSPDIRRKLSKLFEKMLMLLALTFILLLIDLYIDLLIKFIKDFFKIADTPSSSYDYLFSNFNQYFFEIAFLVVIFAPIHEEILFRGILQQGLNRSKTSDFTHYLIQGSTFAFMHLAGDVLEGRSIDFILLHMISTFSFGILATYLRKKYGSLLLPILLHGLGNGISLSFSFITTEYFSINQVALIETAIYILPFIFLFASMLILFLSGNWKISKPKSFKDKNYLNFDFTIKILVLTFIFDITQYAYLFINLNDFESIQKYLLGIILLSILIFILWGVKIRDVTWNSIKEN